MSGFEAKPNGPRQRHLQAAAPCPRGRPRRPRASRASSPRRRSRASPHEADREAGQDHARRACSGGCGSTACATAASCTPPQRRGHRFLPRAPRDRPCDLACRRPPRGGSRARLGPPGHGRGRGQGAGDHDDGPARQAIADGLRILGANLPAHLDYEERNLRRPSCDCATTASRPRLPKRWRDDVDLDLRPGQGEAEFRAPAP